MKKKNLNETMKTLNQKNFDMRDRNFKTGLYYTQKKNEIRNPSLTF